MNGPLVRLAQRASWSGRPRRTLRLRLTLLYGLLFLVSGAGLLAMTYALVSAAPPLPIANRPPIRADTPGAHPATGVQRRLLDPAAATQHAAELHQLLVRSALALLIMAAISVLLGWIMAGRALRPLRAMTLTTRRISADNLHERLSLPGPRDELKDLADTIDGVLTRLEEAFDSQRNFIANASHELRTPLTLTRALLQMRLRDPCTTTDAFRSTCKEVLDAGEQQEQLIESLLTLARSQRGLDRHEPVDLADVATDVADNLQPTAATRRVELHITTQPAPVLGDPYLIERLVTNLVENAIRYNTIDGLVHVQVLQQEEHSVLHIANTGPDVPADQLPQLLQPFQRAATNRGTDGLGLGLSIVAAITHAHDASLSVTPRPEGGLAITVVFLRATNTALVVDNAQPQRPPASQIA